MRFSSRSTSSRRRRASLSHSSRARIASSLPASTACLRSPSASRSASPMIRLTSCSAVSPAALRARTSVSRPVRLPTTKATAEPATPSTPSAIATHASGFIVRMLQVGVTARSSRGAPRFMKTAREHASGGRSAWEVRPAGRAPSKGAERVGLTTEAACTYVLAAPRSLKLGRATEKATRSRARSRSA